ncbi:MAG: hypothetical protein L0H34_09210, partial [Psychrobacter sp.]|nr:hypothetical protein [Psychrobacter sp.]
MLSSRPDRVKASFQRVEALTSITYTVSPASECNKPPMSMSFGLATTLSTSQKLTPQMQQAIKLLQLSSL